MFVHFRATLLVLPLAFLAQGCVSSTADDAAADTAANYGKQTGTAAATPGLLVDAAVQAILNADAEGDIATRSVDRGPRMAARGSATITVSSLTLPNGTAMFPNATGTLNVTWTGDTIDSWPTASAQTVDASVSVSTTNLTYVDSAAGNSVLVNGTLSFTLDGTITSTGTVRNRFNWTSDLVTVMTIPSSSPLSTTVTRNGTSETVTIHGSRRVRHRSSSEEASGATTIATRTGIRSWTRTINGTTSSPAIGDDLQYSQLVATKTIPSLGTLAVTWNRSAQLTGAYDFNVGSADVVTITTPTTTPTTSDPSVYDRTFLSVTLNGISLGTVGPRTAQAMAEYIAASAASLDL